MAQRTAAVPPSHSAAPDSPGARRSATPDTRHAALISAVGRAHPSPAVRRHNWAIPAGRDPFVRFYFPVLAAFRLGAQRARRAAMADEPADTWERRFGRLVRQAREAAGMTQSALEDLAGLAPTTVTRVERGEHDLPAAELADIAAVLGVDPGSLFPPAAGPQRPPAPCPHAGCTGVLVRLPGGAARCSEGHTGSPHGGHTSYDH